MSFLPSVRSPETAVLNRLEAILREGDPLVHDPVAPAGWMWPAGGPLVYGTPGHYCVPEGAKLNRYDVPATLNCSVMIVLAVDGANIQRHLEDDRYWLIPVEVMVLTDRDEETAYDIPALVNDIMELFTVDTAVETAPARLSSDELHVFYIQEKDIQPNAAANGHSGHVLSFTLFCAGIEPTP